MKPTHFQIEFTNERIKVNPFVVKVQFLATDFIFVAMCNLIYIEHP